MRSFLSTAWSSGDLTPRLSSFLDGTSLARGLRTAAGTWLTRIVLGEGSAAAQGQGCDDGISHCDSTHGHHPFSAAELGLQRAAQAMSSPPRRVRRGDAADGPQPQWRLKYCTARSCFSAPARVLNVPRLRRRPVFGLTLRE